MKVVNSDVSFPSLEREMLEAWEHENTFEQTNKKAPAQKEFAFYDGPPFANGLPHYGHLLANTVKDMVPRYWTMRGRFVQRRFGWDCHGVPVEFEVEKKLGLKGRADVLEMGVDKFNESCRESVFHYAGEWKKTISRIGRWVDWDNQYRTLDKEFMESVWWVFSELYKKNYVYLGYKVVPYSPRITAVLSNFEANQNYKTIQDPAITVKFKLIGDDAYLLAWTTTPWTLISNLALCVGPDIQYVKIRDLDSKEIYYVAEQRLSSLYKKAKSGEQNPYEILETVKGSSLTGRKYEPLFPYFSGNEKSFVVLSDSYVSTEEGTGIVHQAPAYGEDDFRICKNNGIGLVDPIDIEGKFKDPVTPYKGIYFKDSDKIIIQDLKKSGALFRHETIEHSYPFCDRTDTPLMYRAINTWYVKVEDHRDRLVENNRKINWVPSHLKEGRMGNWLANATDWAISRNRFWGTPIPIWVCSENIDHRHCISSVSELEALTNTKITDLHKHHIDSLLFPCNLCGAQMKRIDEVFDCWFESGSMPYAQIHYPFSEKGRFDEIFPADFIAEGLDQTRGWFYTLLVLSTLLFDKPAFKNVVVNGIVLAEDGRKMSKRLKNYTAPDSLLEEYGADSVRLYMLNSPILRGENLLFSNKGVKDTTRMVLLPLWNAVSFLTTYANADGWRPSNSSARGEVPKVEDELDKWIISKLQHLVLNVQNQMESYNLYRVVPEIVSYIEDLTNWYIRLNRRRFWGEGGNSLTASTSDAYQTLYYVLLEFTKLFAPLAPFISDKIYRVLVSDCEGVPLSVHLCKMPEPKSEFISLELERRMSLVANITELGRSLRAKHQIKTRQALKSMLVITRNVNDLNEIRQFENILRSELNIKEVHYTTDEPGHVNLALKPNLRTLGPRLGSALQNFRKKFEQHFSAFAEAQRLLELVADGKYVVFEGIQIGEEDLLIDRIPKDDRLIASSSGVTVLLDTKLDESLIKEGLAREIINRIQKLRKDLNLNVSQRIDINLNIPKEVETAVLDYNDYILGETLGVSLSIQASLAPNASEFEIDGMPCFIEIIAH